MRASIRWLPMASFFAGLLAVAAIFLAIRYTPRGAPPAPPRSRAAARLPRLPDDAVWLDSVMSDSLAGHPALLVVWSDTDPRSLALLPMIESWYRVYGRYGVRVIGVHAPDFSFAADSSIAAGVRRRLGLGFPIVLDPAYAIERALGTTTRPAILVADASGAVRLSTGAEGAGEAGRMLREMVRATHPEIAFPDNAGGWAAPGLGVEPRMIFLGTARAGRGPLATSVPGRAQTFTTQFRFQEEGEAYVPYPVGRWTPSAEGLTSERGGAAEFVSVRTEGGRVDAVMSARGPAARVWILADEAWIPPGRRGEDVHADAAGATYVEVLEPRLYALVKGGARVLKLSPEAPGITFYCVAVSSE